MSKRVKPKAPRFHSLFAKRENRNVLIMDRKTLEENIDVPNNTEISLSLSQFQLFPTESLAKDVKVLAATLERTNAEYNFIIYRYDPRDIERERVNVDEYTAWVGLPSHLPRDEMIKSGSTDDDENFRDYENNFVFIKKNRHGKDHHIQSLPKYVNPFEK